MSTPSTPGQRLMRAAWYERKGAAHEVLQVGQMPVPEPGPGEVRVRVAISGISFADGPIEGRTVLVTGAVGGVGQYAVQLAKWGGATVLATISSAEKAEQARSIGADHIINYREEDVAARVQAMTGGAGVDRIVEVAFGANLARIYSPDCMAPSQWRKQ